MTTNEALEWLYKQLRQKRIALGNAERKPNASSEIDDIKTAIDAIEWIIGVVLEQDTECTAVEESHTDTKIERVVEILKAEYERADHMLAHGVIVPPCEVGDTLYYKTDGFEVPLKGKVRSITMYDAGYSFEIAIPGYFIQICTDKDLGNTVFFNYEEAETALVERRKSC